ncbi:ABC transporter ATP-binding protein [Sciscionella sediminilitoris]|uniref:ABC transporter ATP-binding protein n=1 Tax=Sciscionella sediminilitoris TaxID=1445613 RepID=UPI0004DF5698|nr:ABC transporter ATP-binding protein [Sciscionella sp. SE31]
MNGSPAALYPLLRNGMRPYTREVAMLVGCQLVQALAMLYLPTLTAGLVDNGILRGDTGYLLGHGGLMLAATLVQVAATAAAVYLGARVAMRIGADLRAALFARVQRFSVREVHEFGAPSLLTRTTNDVQQVQLLAFILLTLAVTAPFMAIGGLVLALGQDVPLSVVLLVAIPVAIGVIGLIINRMIGPARAMQGRIDTVNGVLREQIMGIRVIRAFVREDHERERFGRVSADLRGVAVRLGRYQAYFGASATLIATLASVAVLAIGGPRVAAGGLQVGSLIAFLNYLAQILGAVLAAMSVFMFAPRARVSASRIRAVLDTVPAIGEPETPAVLSGTGRVRVRGARFGYPGAEEPVLRGVDLRAEPGEVTAVVGSTGSGKTTLVNLIARLLELDEGEVLLDGVDVRALDRASIAAAIGLVPQRAYLFSGTVARNLRFGAPGASEDRLWHALEIAQAAEFVRAMPDGLDTVLGQGGTTVSGGQRQRLAIARALVANPRIYLFDDAFSALDGATDAAVRAALAEELGDATQIVVAQRVSTIRSADRIIVLDAGAVEAAGTHEELLETSPTYTEIVRSQLGTEEVIR